MVTEYSVVLDEIDLTISKLKSWMKTKTLFPPLFSQPGYAKKIREPYGLVLIIGAWNYPVNLTLAPLVGAIAGGNAAIIKPSELASATSDALAELIPKYLDPQSFGVFQGDADDTKKLLENPFDLIFFTGSGAVGKKILKGAAEHLTPVVLELGGKSPAIVTNSSNMALASRRIAWGKFLNSGQTCIAPDYVMVYEDVYEQFLDAMNETLVNFYGPSAKETDDYCRIINSQNFDRLAKYLEECDVLIGGKMNKEDKYMSPTVVVPRPGAKIMEEEIFGPILPIIKIKNIDEAIEKIRSKDKPLALYLYSNKADDRRKVTAQTSSGAVVINDNVIHMPIAGLPFGGIGGSGMGRYHGEYSFDTFTHEKPVLRKFEILDLSVRYPPYNEKKKSWLQWLLRR